MRTARLDLIKVLCDLKSILLEVSSVHGKMSPQFVRSCESFWAIGPRADVGLFSGVSAHVGFEMIRSGEFPLADFALEGPDACVLTAMSSQLIGSREPFPAPVVIADVRLFPGVLSDVHLKVRELQVTLGATRVETDKWFSLLFCLGVHLWLTWGHHVSGLVPYLGNDEGRVSRHSHLNRSGALVHVSIGWDAIAGIGDDLQRESNLLLLLMASWVVLWHTVGEGENWISVSTGHHHVLGHGEMLEWLSGGSTDSDTGHGGADGRGEIWKLSVLMWLLSCWVDQVLGCWLRLHAKRRVLWSVDRRVVRAQFVIGHWGTGVRGVVGRRGKFLVFQVTNIGHGDEIWASILHEAGVW